MDQIKLLVKDVLHKIQDIPDVPFTTIRMSEIASQSSLSERTSRSVSEQSMSTHTDIIPDINNIDCQNNNETVEPVLPKDDIFQNKKDEQPIHIFPEVIEIRKVNSISNDLESLYIDDKGSHDSVYSVPNQSPELSNAGKPIQPKIIMGKRALLRSRSGELQNNPAVVVHDLVHEKYQGKISHYIGRMYQRRLSRESRSTDDDGTSSNYSANSRTPESLYDGKSYFSLYFPPRSEGDFDFINSTDDLNKDTTGEFFSSTMTSVNGNDVSTDLEYDPKKFLKNALGDMSFDSQSSNMSPKTGKLQLSRSVDPINGTSLLSKAGSLYSSVRKSLRRACSFREKSDDDKTANNKSRNRDRCQSFSPDCFGSAENLMRELYVQNGIIFQVSKALTYCRNSNDITSPEYVEAEKILLVASCHKEVIQGALDATEFGEKEKCRQACSGTLEISKVVYYLKGDLLTEEETSKNVDEYFVIVVTNGRTVVSSKVLVPDKNGEIKSDRTFRLTGLRTDFEVCVTIYSMMVKRRDKNHGNDTKKDRKIHNRPTKGFFHLNHNKSPRRSLLVDNVSSIKPSSFTLWGTCTIRCSDLQKTHFRMHHVPLCSTLEGYFTAALTGDVKLSNRTSGFVTVGFEDKAHLIWNRRWCVLDGPLLKYWNYPSEEFPCNPVGVINLTYATENSSPADRSICPRPKTLCLLIKNREDLVLKYFLSADTQEEKQSWQDEINFVIGTLNSWNCLCPKEQVSSF